MVGFSISDLIHRTTICENKPHHSKPKPKYLVWLVRRDVGLGNRKESARQMWVES